MDRELLLPIAMEGNVFTGVCLSAGESPIWAETPWKEHGTRQEVTSYTPTTDI